MHWEHRGHHGCAAQFMRGVRSSFAFFSGAPPLRRARAPRMVEAQPRQDHGICGSGRGVDRTRSRVARAVVGANLHQGSGPQQSTHRRCIPYGARSRRMAETVSLPALPCRPSGLPLGLWHSLAQLWRVEHGRKCSVRPNHGVPRFPVTRACLAAPCPLEPRAWVQGPVRRRCQSQGQRDRQPRTN